MILPIELDPEEKGNSMSDEDEFPDDVFETAYNIADGNHSETELVRMIARAIMAEGERIAVSCLSKRYTEEQGMDAEMDAYNAGLEEAAKLARRSTP